MHALYTVPGELAQSNIALLPKNTPSLECYCAPPVYYIRIINTANKKICLDVDQCHKEMVTSVAVNRGLPDVKNIVCHMLTLQDPSKLTTER